MQKTAVARVQRTRPSTMERGSRSHRAPEFAERSGQWAQLADSINHSSPVQAQWGRAELINQASATAQKEKTALAANPTGLPDRLKAGIETLSGISMDSVIVHYNSSQPARFDALAYAKGTDIHVAPGQEQHLPHEAWHVAQQAQGRVKPTMQLKGGVPVNDDEVLESEAEVMGAKATQMREGTRARLAPIDAVQLRVSPPGGTVCQRVPDLLDIPGKKPNESYLGWGGWRIAKEFASKATGVKRGIESVVGGAGRMVGVDLPGTYQSVMQAGLAPELQQALTAAITTPNGPAVIPPWLQAGQRRPAGGNYAPGPAGPGQAQYGNGHRNQYTAKWGSTYFNEDGQLPGIRGAGGYREYYAQPTTGPCVGDWGSNRVLMQVNDPTDTYWWVTNDHYHTFTYVKDA